MGYLSNFFLISSIIGTITLIGYSLKSFSTSGQKSEAKDGYFDILSYNIAGLPAIISSSKPTKYIKLISPKLNDYDIVNVQEDFAYDKDLTSSLNLKYQTPFSANVPFGDGLRTFSKFPFYMFRRVKWNDTYGFITNGADKMTPKGFTFCSIEIDKGHFIDIYNIHTDAEYDEGSTTARKSNMIQLAEYINGISAGKAILVFGDSNSLYTQEGVDFNELLLKKCNLKDAWIENVMEGKIPSIGPSLSVEDLGQKGEVLDKIWYRSGKNIEINASTFKVLLTEFTDDYGNQLSDHYPVTSRIDYKVLDNILTTDIFGGDKGVGFSFVDKVGGKYPKSITISTGNNIINRIGFTYHDNGFVAVGGKGGTEKTYEFKEGEYITSMTICKNKKLLLGNYKISYINLKTNLDGELSGGTNKILNSKTFSAPEGYAIAGFIGFASDEIDSLGCVYQKV